MIDLCPKRIDYYLQLNNEQDPKIACQSTAASQCIDIIDKPGIQKLIDIGPFKQPEDNIRTHCKDQDAMDLCIRSHGQNWNMSVSHPSEWADVLIYTINKLLGYKCAYYDGNITFGKILDDLNKGIPIQCSMRFLNISGHYISVVGITDDSNLIVNDPYKDWLHGGLDGYHVIYTAKDWQDHFKGYGIRYNKKSS
jgi:hypothetical protein